MHSSSQPKNNRDQKFFSCLIPVNSAYLLSFDRDLRLQNWKKQFEVTIVEYAPVTHSEISLLHNTEYP